MQLISLFSEQYESELTLNVTIESFKAGVSLTTKLPDSRVLHMPTADALFPLHLRLLSYLLSQSRNFTCQETFPLLRADIAKKKKENTWMLFLNLK